MVCVIPIYVHDEIDQNKKLYQVKFQQNFIPFIPITADMNNHINIKNVIITHPCPEFSGSIIILPLKLEDG